MILPPLTPTTPADRAEAALRILGVETYRTARAVLPMWAGYGLLSSRDVRRVLARFGTPGAESVDQLRISVPTEIVRAMDDIRHGVAGLGGAA